MTSVESTLRNRAAQKQGSLVGYFPAGYPSVEQSVQALVAMANNGCNILEIGVPYSDPVMDGPVIQRATETAQWLVGLGAQALYQPVLGLESQPRIR